MKTYSKVLLLSVLACVLSACHSLAPGGVYTDRVAYDADLTIATSYEMIHSFVTWEFQNRAALSSNPQVKATADKFRLNAPTWFKSAVTLRDAYATSQSKESANALTAALDVLRAAVKEATTMLAGNTVTTFN